MFKKVSKTSEINARLEKEDKVTLLNSDDDINQITAINEYMEGVRKDYQIKESKSQISASHVILNA
ncbi:MAG: hypothetical protein ACQERU_08090 [Bacteroidota bacterium]|jgi:hypothetical protein